MNTIKPTPAPTLRQILRFRCIESSADVHRRFQAKYAAQRATGKGARVRGIDVHYIEPEILSAPS